MLPVVSAHPKPPWMTERAAPCGCGEQDCVWPPKFEERSGFLHCPCPLETRGRGWARGQETCASAGLRSLAAGLSPAQDPGVLARAPAEPAPAHAACSFFLRLCSEVPILEDTLMRILVIGLSRELPLGPADAMELADHLVKRAAAVQADGNGPLAPSVMVPQKPGPCPSSHQGHLGSSTCLGPQAGVTPSARGCSRRLRAWCPQMPS